MVTTPTASSLSFIAVSTTKFITTLRGVMMRMVVMLMVMVRAVNVASNKI